MYSKKIIGITKYFLLAACLVLLVKYSEGILSGLRTIGRAMVPLIYGLAIAYVLNILMKKLEKVYFPKSKSKFVNKSRRIVCIFLSILLIIGIIVILSLIVIPEFVNAVSAIIAAIPKAIEAVKEFITTNSDKYEVVEKAMTTLQVDVEGALGQIMSTASSILTGVMNSILAFAGAFTSSLFNFLISIVFAIYVLADKENLSVQIRRVMKAFLKDKSIDRIEHVTSVANEAFTSFIVGQCVEAVIIGCLCALGMLLLGLPYAVTVGAFIGATALIPVVGAYLGAALGAFMILTVSPGKALVFLIFISILQQLENNLIYPRVVGSSIGLPGIWVFAAITIGGGLGGIVGMLLSVPIAATLYKLFVIKVHNRLESQTEEPDEPQPEAK